MVAEANLVDTLTCADIGIFVRGGGPGQPYKKSSDNVFFCVCVFLSPQLIFRSQTVNFKEIYDFSRFQRGSNIFQGGGLTFSRLILYRNQYNL